jgi:FAD/FMN-containing dehydrogenase
MCAGAVPDASGEQVLLNLSRMNRIRQLDAADFSMVAEAGCVLADLKRAAEEAGRYFPLSISAEGSCQIGGNLATNAGGLNVVRYGTARSHVLGLEVVLADGTVWNGLRTLRKDTAGYDLKQLFIGSEGTLGIITAAALELVAPPGETTTAFVSLQAASDAVTLLGDLREAIGERIQAIELIGARAMEFVERYIPDAKQPFDAAAPWYLLIDIAAGDGAARLEEVLGGALEAGRADDVVIAKNAGEAARLWHLRHSISEAERRAGRGVKHDISVPPGRLREFIDAAEKRLSEAVPEAEPVIFGHVGDGNLHYNAHLPPGLGEADDARLRAAVSEVVYELATEMGGSISAEHGVGVLKKAALERYGDPTGLGLMRALKATLDPANILNPGKVI